MEEPDATGASFTAATSAFTCTAVAEASAPSQVFTVKAFKPEPFALLAAFHCNFSPEDSSVVPASTAFQVAPFHFCKLPVLTDSIRKLMASPSTSASLHAVVRSAYVISWYVSSANPVKVVALVSVGTSFIGVTTIDEVAVKLGNKPSLTTHEIVLDVPGASLLDAKATALRAVVHCAIVAVAPLDESKSTPLALS